MSGTGIMIGTLVGGAVAGIAALLGALTADRGARARPAVVPVERPRRPGRG